MSGFQRILLAIDFGAPSDKAAELACDVARKYGAHLTVVHVYPLPTATYGAYPMLAPIPVALDVKNAAEQAFEERLATLKQLFPDLTPVLREGEPSEEILIAAKDSAADLIVLGTHGHRGVARLFLGSVTEKVMRLSPIPVLVVRTADKAPAAGG